MLRTRKPIDLDALVLQAGEHRDPSEGLCVMEAIAYFRGEPHTDHPVCVSPAIGALLQVWNDSLPDDETRTRLLVPLIPEVVGTAPAPSVVEEARAWLACDWLLRVCAPTWLDLVPSLAEHASALRQLPAMGSALGEAELAAANRVASAAWAAARAAARSAAEAAAWSAAWSAAGAAAEAAAEAAAWAAGWAAAWAAAEAAAGAAAEAAGWAAAWAAGAEALIPPITTLQASAQDLVRRMAALHRIPVEGVVPVGGA